MILLAAAEAMIPQKTIKKIINKIIKRNWIKMGGVNIRITMQLRSEG